jgi:hypothetical protein
MLAPITTACPPEAATVRALRRAILNFATDSVALRSPEFDL